MVSTVGSYWRFDVLHWGQDSVVYVFHHNLGDEEFKGRSFSSHGIHMFMIYVSAQSACQFE